MEIIYILWCISFILFLFFLAFWIIAAIKKDTHLMFRWSYSMMAAALAMNLFTLIKNLL